VTANIAEKRFDLVGISQGVPAAIHYAARHPERVRKLVLFGGFASGWRLSESAKVHAHFEALITLTGSGWGKDNPAFRQLFTSQFLPDATPEQAGWFNELQRVSASPEEAQRLQRAIGGFDVRHLLGKVRAPTIVFHCRGDGMVPVGNGHLLASSIAGAEFVGLESDNHLLLEEEPAWPVFAGRLREFLAR
jgi:pimeloyl-ACP methyl ester carboxylesterase